MALEELLRSGSLRGEFGLVAHLIRFGRRWLEPPAQALRSGLA
jgi:hypothetical protein